MTIVLGINFGDYVLLAADTRALSLDLSGRAYYKNDDHEKIGKTNIGIVAGRGDDTLLQLIKSKFNEINEIISTDDLKRVVNNERYHFSELCPEIAEQSIKGTAWLFSYLTFSEGTFKHGTPILRLGVIGYAGDIVGRRHLVDNYAFVIPPPEATDQDASTITNMLNMLIRPIEQFKTRQESIDYHWQLIANLIRLIKPKFPSISSSCQIGVHTLNGFTGISSILTDKDATASIVLTPPPPPPNIISTVEQSTTLTSEAYGFKITYPETWRIEEAPSVYDSVRVRIFLPTGDQRDTVSIAVYRLERNTTLDGAIKYAVSNILSYKEVSFLSDEYSTIANYPSYIMLFQAIFPVQVSEMSSATKDATLKMKQTYVVHHDLLYVITYQTVPDRYDTYLALAQRIMNSFDFVRRPDIFEPNERS